MGKFIKTLAIVVFFTTSMSAQIDFENFKGLKASGPVPEEFTESLEAKLNSAINSIEKDDKSRKRVSKEKDFHKSSQYYIHNLFTSGRLIYGDPVTNYVQQVLDKVLADYGNTKKKFRVFTVKSASFNAAATNDGILLVNLGLLAQVENEAQLAFILAHEIIHSEEDHVLEGYIERKSSTPNFGMGEDEQQKEERLLSMSNFTKALELEADKEAYNRFMVKSGYDPFEAIRMIDVMLYSYLPFDEVAFDRSFFNKGHFRVKSDLFPKEVKPITALENFDDSKSTHPNLRTRKDALEDLYTKTGDKSGKLFLIDEKEFYEAQKAARFEMVSTYLLYRDYPEVIYNAALLLRDNPNNKYLRESIAIALHTLSTYKNNQSKKILGKVEDVEGEMQAVYHFLTEISSLDLNVLAAQNAFQLYKDYPENAFAKRLFETSMKELINFHDIKADFFYEEVVAVQETPEKEPEAEEETSEKIRGRSSKVQTLKKQRDYSNQTDSIRMAFVGEFQNPLFTDVFNAQLEDLRTRKAEKTYISESAKRELRKKPRNEKSKNKTYIAYEKNLKENPLPIEKVVLANTEYVVNKTASTSTGNGWIRSIEPDYEKVIGKKESYLAACVTALEKSKIPFEVVDLNQIKTDNSEALNHAQFAKLYFEEYWAHPAEENMVSLSRYADDFIAATGTPYILYSGAYVTLDANQAFMRKAFVGGILAFAYIPSLVYSAPTIMKPDMKGVVYTLLFDVRSGEMVYTRIEPLKNDYIPVELEAITYGNIVNLKTIAK